MASLPTPEDNARIILNIFKEHNLRPGEILMLGTFQTYVGNNGVRAEDLNEGLQHCVQQGWIIESEHGFKLTDEGFEEI